VYFYLMKSMIKERRNRPFYMPENVGGGCMTGKVSTNAGAKKISSYIADYKSNRILFSSKTKSIAGQKVA